MLKRLINMNGYFKMFKEQLKALSDVYEELLKPIEKQSTLDNWWVFGGGTALSIFHFNHRKSFDIDIFITESQLFDFLNPKWFIDESNLFNQEDYRFDNANKHIQLKTKDDIKIDFILNEAIINPPIKNTTLNLEYTLYYESIEDIIAKKIKWRKEDNLARDIFDIALAISKDNKTIPNLLDSRFIGTQDLKILNNSLNELNIQQYNLEIEKIQPTSKEYLEIALNGKNIIQSNIELITSKNMT